MTTRTFYCPRCRKFKESEEFLNGWVMYARGTSYCKPCRASYKRDKRTSVLVWYREQKNKPCVDCGIQYHHAAMQFDHKPEETKLFNISHNLQTSINILELEIAKCDLVCANCHAVRTFNRNPTKYELG